MRRSTRMRLDMIHRVHALCQKHPSTIPGYIDAMRQLGDRLARAEALAAQQEAGDLQAEASRVRKDALRQVIEEDYLVHLVRIARVALPTDPGLRNRFRLPERGVNRQEFVAAVRAILAQGATYRAVFVTEGMAETYVEDLEEVLGQYLEALNQKVLGEARRVGAVAELPEVAKELMQLVRRLDGINRKRWQRNPEMLAAWRSVKDVTWPHLTLVEPEGGAVRRGAWKARHEASVYRLPPGVGVETGGQAGGGGGGTGLYVGEGCRVCLPVLTPRFTGPAISAS